VKKIIIESPFAGDTEKNKEYLALCFADSLARGEAPYASHALYTQFLDDNDPEQRKQGIECGQAWGKQADLIAVYTDHGISDGMSQSIEKYYLNNIPIVNRSIMEKAL